MTGVRLILRSLAYYLRYHVGVALGAAIATAVITGALLTGDSIRYTLAEAAHARLGQTGLAMSTVDRFFTTDLADRIADVETPVSAILQLQGVATVPGLDARANDVQVIGVDDVFGGLLGGPDVPRPGEVVVNDVLAHQLGVSEADTVLLRLAKPSALPQDAPVGFAEDDNGISLRLDIVSVAPASQGGRFSLRAEQTPAPTAFVNRQWLGEQLGLAGRANVMLTDQWLAPDAAEQALRAHWTLADAQLVLKVQPDGGPVLQSPRVFLDDATADALSDLPAIRVLTYFVNTIAHRERTTPYSMVAAIEDGIGEDQIVINSWLAEDLAANVGDKITLTYYMPDAGRRLAEASATFTVAKIVPIEGDYADQSLVPDFPGLDDVDSLSDWDGGPMIDRSRLRDKDEAYWDQHRATPKAFIALPRGQELWSNRYGKLTSIRFTGNVDEQTIRGRLDPAAFGLAFRDVHAEARAASKATVDFGSLFLSLSFFIIASSVLLTGLLFTFSIEQRSAQIGVLLATGWPVRRVRRVLLAEGAVVAAIGSALGVLGGIAYAAAVIAILSGAWSGAVAQTPILFHIGPWSPVIGFASGMIVAVGAMGWSIRGISKQPARQLLAGRLGAAAARAEHAPITSTTLAIIFAAVAIAFVLFGDAGEGMAAAGLFFGLAAMLLTAGILATYALLAALSRSGFSDLSLSSLALRVTTRRRGRSLAVVILLASGLFLVIAIAGFHQSTPDDPTRRDCGTGGFSLIVESTLPILYDLNTGIGRDHFGLDPDDLPDGSVVSLRVSGGDDASCLNLNRVPTPRLLGVDPDQLARRGAFVVNHPDGWAALESSADDAIPAFADQNTAQWALKLKVGDTIDITDGNGLPVKVRLVGTVQNSILQGSLIIDHSQFVRLFPDTAGYRLLLVDPPPADAGQTSRLLTRAMSDVGAAVTPTTDRLAAYNAVQNTYLAIFQALGGLGVVLGTCGLGIVVMRNVLERRRELAMMRAMGYRRPRLRRLVMTEHVLLLTIGAVVGTGAALVAVVPVWRGASAQTPTALTILGVCVLGLLSVWIASRIALRGNLQAALRHE